MEAVLRTPIHANSPRGRLRKQPRHPALRPQAQPIEVSNSPTPEISSISPHKIHRCKFFLKTRKQPPVITEKEEEGSFRAIHTSHQKDTLKGFPLRSVTPIRPFRRGIRAQQLQPYPTVNLEDIRSRRISFEKKRSASETPHSITIENIITIQKPLGVGVVKDSGDEFFKIRAPITINRTSMYQALEARGLAGTRISPMLKPQIRTLQAADAFVY